MAEVTILDRELYDEGLASSILRVPRSTLHYWLEGGERQGKLYEPVLRSVPTGTKVVTWGELVEAAYLREYRRTHDVPLPTLRSFILHLRDQMGVPYPLAHARPWVGPGRQLLIEAQESSELDPEYWGACYVPQSGMAILTHPAAMFLERVEFDGIGDGDGFAIRLRPVGRTSPVVIDPEIRFGSPTVNGIPTEALAEQVHAGDTIEDVAEDFNLTLDSLIAALDFERTQQNQAA